MALFGSNQNGPKPKSGDSGKNRSRLKPHDCKICGNPKARHAKGKCFEDTKIKTSRNSGNTKIIRNGQNLMTTVKPRLTIRMKIVISMHQDSEA